MPKADAGTHLQAPHPKPARESSFGAKPLIRFRVCYRKWRCPNKPVKADDSVERLLSTTWVRTVAALICLGYQCFSALFTLRGPPVIQQILCPHLRDRRNQ